MLARAGTIIFEREISAMAAKEVASALALLTSDSLPSCKSWNDNCFVEAFIADYFTGSTDETSDLSSDDDLTGTFQSYKQVLSIYYR